MSNTVPLPKEIMMRIEIEASDFSVKLLKKESYFYGAIREAKRAQPLIEALKKIQGICDHDDYGNAATNCPVCIAHFAIEEYNNPLP